MANGDLVIVGGTLTATTTTTIANNYGTAVVLRLVSGSGTALEAYSKAEAAIRGKSDASWGVVGSSGYTAGVIGLGNTGVMGRGSTVGVWGITTSKKAPGVIGRSGLGTGVLGHNQGETPPPAASKTGVYGHSVVDARSRGVWGHSETGRGVVGDATSGTGVVAAATTGYALATSGRLRFDRVSGVATIPAGAKELVVAPGVDVTAGAFVFLTPRANIGSRALWFTTDPAADTFTIRLSTARGSATAVSWLLVESPLERASI